MTGSTGAGRASARGGTPDWMPAGVDPQQANVARVYDYWLGGTHNFLADQDLGRSMAAVAPNIREIARANRDFLGRAVRFLLQAGVRQFLDIGSGIPTQGNVHEVAQQADPEARIVYVDIDPVAIAHSTSILAGNRNAAIIDADLRQPETILDHPATRRLLDPGQPTGLLLVSVLHFIGDSEDPEGVVARLRDRLAPGSFLVLSHATNESRPDVTRAAGTVYRRRVPSQGRARSRAEVARLFDGFDLVEPGLVYVPQWRPDDAATVPGDPAQIWFLAGVGQRPG